MDQLPITLLHLIVEILSKRWARIFVFLGVISFITFALMGMMCLSTYIYVAHDYEMQMQAVSNRALLDVCVYSARVARLEGEIEAYQQNIEAFSRRGRRKPLGRFTVTAYDPVESCKPFDDGITAKSIPVGMGIAAVDPGVIPYGSVLYFPELSQYFFASDTGAAMKRGTGRNIDLLMPTVKQALAFGRRSLSVELIDLSEN